MVRQGAWNLHACVQVTYNPYNVMIRTAMQLIFVLFGSIVLICVDNARMYACGQAGRLVLVGRYLGTKLCGQVHR